MRERWKRENNKRESNSERLNLFLVTKYLILFKATNRYT